MSFLPDMELLYFENKIRVQSITVVEFHRHCELLDKWKGCNWIRLTPWVFRFRWSIVGWGRRRNSYTLLGIQCLLIDRFGFAIWIKASYLNQLVEKNSTITECTKRVSNESALLISDRVLFGSGRFTNIFRGYFMGIRAILLLNISEHRLRISIHTSHESTENWCYDYCKIKHNYSREHNLWDIWHFSAAHSMCITQS